MCYGFAVSYLYFMKTFKTEYDELFSYVKMYYKKWLSECNTRMSETELLSEAYIIGFNDIIEAKKAIRHVVQTERRKCIADFQLRIGTSDNYVKQCRKCKEHKSTSQFTRRFDTRTNLSYYCYVCKDCEKILRNSDEAKKKSRERYASDPKYKEARRLRYAIKQFKKTQSETYLNEILKSKCHAAISFLQ